LKKEVAGISLQGFYLARANVVDLQEPGDVGIPLQGRKKNLLRFCIVGVSIQTEPIEKPQKTRPISVEKLNSIPFNLSFASPLHSSAERHNLPELWTFSDVVFPLLNLRTAGRSWSRNFVVADVTGEQMT
jgi:hypothetical protein